MKLGRSWGYCVLAVLTGFHFAGPGASKAGNWPQWRGPTGKVWLYAGPPTHGAGL